MFRVGLGASNQLCAGLDARDLLERKIQPRACSGHAKGKMLGNSPCPDVIEHQYTLEFKLLGFGRGLPALDPYAGAPFPMLGVPRLRWVSTRDLLKRWPDGCKTALLISSMQRAMYLLSEATCCDVSELPGHVRPFQVSTGRQRTCNNSFQQQECPSRNITYN